MDESRIILAHEADFGLASILVRPSTREIVRDGETVIVEPRVMQVLVALAKANGAVVSKDDLTLRCWDGRVVGEDAINRVMSRLRRLSEETQAFRIETVARVGYRLLAANASARTASLASAPSSYPSRRVVLIGGAALAAAGTAAGGWYALREPPVDPKIAALIERADEAVRYGTLEQNAAGIALLEDATRKTPDSALLWGRLAIAYGDKVHSLPSGAADEARAKALDAARRALKLDPRNEDAQVLQVLCARPTTLLARDSELADVAKRFPKHQAVNLVRAFFMMSVGRAKEAADYGEVAAKSGNGPYIAMWRALALHAIGRQDEADAVIDEAFELWPRHYAVWFTRYKNLAFSDRPEAAAKMVADVARRPTGIQERNFSLCAMEVQALSSREPADIAKAMDEHLNFSRIGAGYIINAIGFASAVGLLDTAFALADAHYFDRGFKVGERRYGDEQGLFTKVQDRPRWFLFLPNAAAMRADARFAKLTQELGLEKYWRECGVQPDYRLKRT